MVKVIKKLIIFVGLIVIAAACNPDPKQQSSQNTVNKIPDKQVFLIGKGPNTKESIIDMIEKSDINEGGYVVILTTSFLPNDENAIFLKKEFYERQIVAVHIVGFKPKSIIQKSDILTIENASIICILGGNRNKFMKLVNKTQLKGALLQAYENGVIIAGIGNAAFILGDFYYNQFKNEKTQVVEIEEKPGLGLLKNTVVEDISFFRNYKDVILSETTKRNLLFIGLGYQARVWVENENAQVLGTSEVGFIAPGKPPSLLKKDNTFELIP